MKEYDVCKLDDNQEYILADKVTHNKKEYCLLIQTGNFRNIVIRKITNENNKKFLTTVSEEEFDEVVNIFSNKGFNFN